MEVVEKLILWVLILCAGVASAGRVVLNGPEIQTSDLRAIDGYVASGLPLFASTTHGFVLHSGMRPVIVKVKDPTKVIRDGIEQPNAGYYRDLPSVIPQGFEGVATTSFLLGHPIPPSNLFTSSGNPGPVVQHLMQQQQQQQAYAQQHQTYAQQQQQFQQQQQQPQQFQQQQQPQQPQAEQSIRIEQTVQARSQIENNNRVDDSLTTNPVVVKTSEFESTLPDNFRNQFYSNRLVANQLAQHSLPAPGEEVVKQWNTNKIADGRVRDLLRNAGLI